MVVRVSKDVIFKIHSYRELSLSVRGCFVPASLKYLVEKVLNFHLFLIFSSFEHGAPGINFLLDVSHLLNKLLEHIKLEFFLSTVVQQHATVIEKEDKVRVFVVSLERLECNFSRFPHELAAVFVFLPHEH